MSPSVLPDPYVTDLTMKLPNELPTTAKRTKNVELDDAEGNAPITSNIKLFAPAPFNIQAVQACQMFLAGQNIFVAIVGPSGWGKTHLLHATGIQASELCGEVVSVVNAADWVCFKTMPPSKKFLILDDIQDAIANPRTRQNLRRFLELRKRLRRPTLISMTSRASMISSLPLSRDWNVASIREPDIDERRMVTVQIAKNQEVNLTDGVVNLIAKHVNGNGRSIEGALQRLKLRKTDWDQDKDTVKAAGVLMPYLLGHNGWDPRDSIYDTVAFTVGQARKDSYRLIDEISAFVMSDLAELSEDFIASFFKVKPADVYTMANRIKDDATKSPVDSLIQDCRSAVVRAFNGY